MAKQKQAQNLSLFEQLPTPTSMTETRSTLTAAKPSSSTSSLTRIDPLACPKCGGRSQLSVRPAEMGGTRYCPVCQGEDGCYYFTPALTNAVAVSDPVAPSEPEQVPLIETGEKWEEHWRGMPEFVQENLMPWKTVQVHFESREDMEKFSKLVKQKIGLNTQFIWYPEAEINHAHTKRLTDSK